MHWDYTFVVIILILAVVVPWRSGARVRALLQVGSLASRERLALYASTIAFQWVISLFIVWRCSADGIGLVNLGFALPHLGRAIAAATAISAVLLLNQVLGVLRLARLPMENRGVIGQLAGRLLPRSPAEKWAALALVLTVAICEEFIYRGFIQSLFQAMLHSVAAGAAISAAFFAVAHAYQGKRGIITTFTVGLVFSGTRIWTGSLFPAIIIHFAVDFSAGAASIRLLLGTSK